MRQFLAVVLAVSVGLSLIHIFYLALSLACIVAIVVNSYFETKLSTLENSKKEVMAFSEEVRNIVKKLEAEQGVLKLKVQNLSSPGRKA